MSNGFKLHGFKSPNYTSVPDEFFDIVAPNLTEAELRALIYIMRRTFGFKKDSDNISLRQMVEGIRTKDGRVLDLGTGLSKPSVVRAVKGLIEKEIIVATRRTSADKGDEPTTYSLLFQNGPVLTKATRGGNPKQHGGVNESNPQETVLQETGEQQTHISNVRIAASPKSENVDNSPALLTNHDATQSTIRQVTTGEKNGEDGGFEPVSAIVTPKVFRQPPQTYDEARQVIADYIADFARELGDEAKLKASVTRATNLYRKSGLELSTFIGALVEARSRTQQATAQIKKRRSKDTGPYAQKNKMPFYFAVIEDLLGLKDSSAAESSQDTPSP